MKSPIPDSALTQHIAFVGKTGSGKSYAAKGIVERLVKEGRRVCVIDPGGDWWGLRAAANGKGPGLPVAVLGGSHADVAIAPTAGADVARFIAEHNLPCVVDVSEWYKTDQIRFMTDFAETVYKENRAALHLVIDEADQYSPQNPMPESRKLSNRMEMIVRLGRKRGFRVMMITQRPQILHKNVLTQVNTLVSMRLTSPQDKKAIQDWIRDNASKDDEKRVLQSLSRLDQGVGWVWAPEEDILEKTAFPKTKTFDAGRSPEDGEVYIEPTNFAEVDTKALSKLFAPPPAEDEKTVSPGPAAPDPRVPELEEQLRSMTFERDQFHATACAMDKENQQLRTALEDLAAKARATLEEVGEVIIPTIEQAAIAPDSPALPPVPQNGAPQSRSSDPLIAAAESIWPVRLTWSQLCAMCGRKARGGHFNKTKKQLQESGLVTTDQGLVTLTSPPSRSAGLSPADLLEQNLPNPANRMFAAIRRRPGMTREELAAELGMQPRGGHWNNGFSILRNNDLVSDEGDGSLRIHSSLA